MESKLDFAVIGGSGIYSMPGLIEIKDVEVNTPFGKPSAPVKIGSLGGRKIAFLARHGIGHHISPTEVNYRANIFALKTLGIDRIISISACGSLREDFAPGDIVIPDQLFDFTHLRPRTLFGDGLVAHVGAAEPFCGDWSTQVFASAQKAGADVHAGGTLITIEGPRFSTKAESQLFRSWGFSIIGMTASPEAFLAKEAEMCYATMAHVTDYDVWHVSMEPVSVDMVIKILNKNTAIAQDAIRYLAENLRAETKCDCQNTLAPALITNREIIPQETKEKLNPLIGKYIK